MNNKKQVILLPCPCCGTPMFTENSDYDICSVCNWENDPYQMENPNVGGGANELSLIQAQQQWLQKNRASQSN